MVKEAFVSINFQDRTLTVIEQANRIISEYAAQGFTMTLRQLYYQFVARDLLVNRLQSYKRLGSIISNARSLLSNSMLNSSAPPRPKGRARAATMIPTGAAREEFERHFRVLVQPLVELELSPKGKQDVSNAIKDGLPEMRTEGDGNG